MIIDSPIISGSLSATGSLNQIGDVVISGSLTVTGSIIGNISGLATSASFATSALTASNALTASHADNFDVTNNLTVGGTITAQSIYVQTVTSSISYITGSTIFGSLLSNTHQLTGSVTVTGSLQVNGLTPVYNNQTSSMSVLSASFSTSGSFAISASSALTAISASAATNAVSASYAISASYAANVPQTSSYALSALTASYAISASYAANVPETSSYALSALTASYALNAGAGAGFPYSGSAVITGSLLISNLTGSGVRYLVADDNGNITAQSASAAILTTQTVTASAGQTVFPITNGYTTGLVTVYINGSKLNGSEYIDTSGTSITLLTGSNDQDIVEFVKYFPASGVTNNALRQKTTFRVTSSQSVFGINYTPGLLDIYYNGSHLTDDDYTANTGTSFTLATASAAGDILDVFVYTYQVGAFSGIGGTGASTQVAYFSAQSAITGSPNLTYDGSTLRITGSFIISGSNTFTNIGPTVFSGSVTSLVGFTGSFSGTATNATSASYAANTDLLNGNDSAVFATTGSNTLAGTQNITNTTQPTNFDSTAAVYTAGGLRVKGNVYVSSSLYLKGDLTVYGTQSINYITSSQLDISDNIINVNTATPGIRFGGIAVYDSGSTGLTGSFLWDSQNNKWVYSNPSGSGYDGGMAIFGPRNTSGLGNEQGTTSNALMKGQGGDHITSSLITEDGNLMSVYSTMYISSSGFVGIGTTIPSASLHIYKAATTSSQPQLVIANPTSNTGDAAGIRFSANTISSTWDVKFQTAKGIDWFQMTNDAGTSVKHSWYDTKYYPGVSSNGGSGTGYISGDGTNIGIGTTSPSYNFHVPGTATLNSVKFLNGTSYNENIRCYPSVNDWSSIILGSISGDSGTGTGQWSLLRWPTATYSNQFSIRHGGSDTIVINTSGQITTPSQPAFYAYGPGNGATSSVGNYTNFGTTRLNRGSHYNTSTGRFTAPVAGVYRFVFASLYRQKTGTGSGEISISINGSNVSSRGMAYGLATNSTDTHIPMIAELVINLNANDYVMPYIYSVGSGSDFYMDGNLAYFSGYLIG